MRRSGWHINKVVCRDAVIRSIDKDSCATLGPPFKSLVEIFRACHNSTLSKYFRAGSMGSHFLAYLAIDCINFRFLYGAASDEGGESTKAEDVVDPRLKPKSITCI